jgi:hypothetical protein
VVVGFGCTLQSDMPLSVSMKRKIEWNREGIILSSPHGAAPIG